MRRFVLFVASVLVLGGLSVGAAASHPPSAGPSDRAAAMPAGQPVVVDNHGND